MLEKSPTQLVTQSRERLTQSIHFITNHRLIINYHSTQLDAFLDLPQANWTGHSLATILPELSDCEKALPHDIPNPGDSATYKIWRLTETSRKPYEVHFEHIQKQNYLVQLTAVLAQPQIEQLENQNQTLKLLNKASQALIETLDSKIVLERILQVTNKIIGAEGSSVWLWDDQKPGWLVCQAAHYPDHVKSLIGERVQQGQGLAGWVGMYGKSAVVLDTNEDLRFYPGVDNHSGFKTQSIIAVPLNMREGTIGVLEIVNKNGGSFTENDQTVAETIAASAAIAIENARLVEALQTQMQDLQDQNEELDAFDHSVAHDLQNPLSLIVGFTDVLRQAEHKDIPEKDRKGALEMIMTSAQKMSTIIHELLLLSSIRKVEVEKVPINMEDIVDAALMRVSHMLDEYDAKVIRPDIWPIALGHAAWIEEIWENYISNAIKYGGRPPVIELGATLESNGQIVRFWVHDNGQGLTLEEQSRLFAPFTRLSSIRVTGQGLGLSIVQRIMNKLDGEVGVESIIGEGSTFSFKLPVADM
ncbi:MAG: GAF domain-containing sensor histidine kinase [Chloroflexota bacterium]